MAQQDAEEGEDTGEVTTPDGETDAEPGTETGDSTDIQQYTEPEAAEETTAVSQAAADADTQALINLLYTSVDYHTFFFNPKTDETEDFVNTFKRINEDTSGTGAYTIVFTGDFELDESVTLERNSVTLLGVQTTLTLNKDSVGLTVSEGASMTVAGSLTVKAGTDCSCTLFTVNGGTFSLTGNACLDANCSADSSNYGRCVLVENGGTFHMTGGKITNGKAPKGGGAFICESSTMTMSGGSIENCEAVNLYDGGGIFVSNGSHLEMSGGSVINCTGGSGGGVSIWGDEDDPSTAASMVMTGGSIENCSTPHSGGGILVTASVLALNGGHISNCTANTRGGGVWVSRGTVTMDGGAIQNCTATSSTSGGGGIWFDSGSLVLSSGKIEYCTAHNGGGIGFLDDNVTITMNGGSITNCTATNGGGISGLCPNASTDDRLILNGGSITDCTATNGGGIRLATASMTMGGAHIENCSAQLGGGVYLKSGVLTMTSDSSINNCLASGSDKNSSYGGGVYADGSTVSMTDTSTIADCSTASDLKGSGDGGGLYLINNSSLAMDGSSTIANCKVRGYSEFGGGGVHLASSSTMTLTGSGSITDCTTMGYNSSGPSARGGGVSIDNSTFRMESGSITNCSGGSGGGVCIGENDGSLIMTGGSIANCSSSGGGGIYAVSGTVDISGDSKIENCTSWYGGGIGLDNDYPTYPSLTMTGGSITGCHSNYVGGGLYIYTASGSMKTLKNVHISDCSASADGGAISIMDLLTLENCTIENCTAQDGGGVCIRGGTLNMIGSSITGCHAKLEGGGISTFLATTHLKVEDSVICNNTAGSYAADIFLHHSSDTTISLPNAADMQQAYQNSGYMIDGWYNDPEEPRYEPNADGVPVDITSLPTSEDICLVASYRADDNATPDTTAHTITVALPEDIAFVEGQTVVNAPATAVLGDEVALTFNAASLPADCGKAFGEWSVTDAKGNTLTVTGGKFKMPASNVTVTFTLVDADAPAPAPASGGSSSGGAGIGVLVGGVAVGAVGYAVGTRLWLEHNIGFVPTDRQQLAGALWNKAGCPAPESTALYPDIAEDDADAQAASRWCVEQGLLADYGETFHPGDHVYRFQAIKAWNMLQDRLNAQA